MKQHQAMCPILTAAMIISSGRLDLHARCHPDCCMWAMRKTAKGEDGRYRTVGYRCAIATGSDRYVEVDE